MDSFPDSAWDPNRPEIERLLRVATVTDSGLIPSASNYVFVLALEDAEAGTGHAVYKPARGEQPLWDFPLDIYRREVASYLVSEAIGWRLVPPTIIREDGLPHGIGSLQAFIPTDHNCTFFDLRDAHADDMRRMAIFDWLTNNADRKGGHVLQGSDEHIWGIDNALSFHIEEKLRTVIWDYAGDPVPEPLLADVETFVHGFHADTPLWKTLSEYLEAEELRQIRVRGHEILRDRVFPQPPETRRPYPWPLI
jgi:uncharacterized repeat protein (TIGR03843 family)